MNSSPAVIYVAASAEQAHLLAAALRERGIEADVTNDQLQVGRGILPFGMATAPRVIVPELHASEGRKIVLDLLGESVEKRPPLQFSMRAILILVGVVSIYIGIDRATGWKLTGVIPYLIGFLEWCLIVIPVCLIFRRKYLGRTRATETS